MDDASFGVKPSNRIKIIGGLGILGIICFILLIVFGSLFYFQTEAGYNYHYQNSLTGKETIYTKPDVHLKLPGFSTITRYKQVFTISYIHMTPQDLKSKRATRTGQPIEVLFADTYTAKIPGTFRFKLPLDKAKMIKIHNEFRSFENLVASLAEKTAKDVMINTATQYTGEEFLLGAINQFKASVIDQLKNGIYKTQRRQVEVEETSLAAVGLGQEDSNMLRKTKKLVWKTIPLKTLDGQFIRQENPLQQYGIEATQFTMGRPKPEAQLETLLTDKKTLVADRIKAVQEQETAKEQAKTAQLKKDIERTRARQEALKQKEMAVIAMQQQVEQAEKQADKERVEQEKRKALALIKKQQELEVEEYNRKTLAVKKQKELDVAVANRDIQKANYEAAKYEAQAIREKGLAEADVIRAKYAAFNAEIYVQELRRDMAQYLYSNLGDFTVEMPRNMIVGSGSGNGSDAGLLNNLNILANLGILKGLEAKAAPEPSDPGASK